MNKEQAQTALNLANVAISTIQKIAEQEKELLNANERDIRYVRAILLLQEKQKSTENFLKRTENGNN